MNKYEEDSDGKLHPHCVNLTATASVFPKEYGTRYLAANLNANEAPQPMFTGTKRKVDRIPQKKRVSSSSRKDKEGVHSFSTSTPRRREDLFDSMSARVSHSSKDPIISRFLRDTTRYAGKQRSVKLSQSEPTLNQTLRDSHDLPRKYMMPTKSAPSRKHRFLKEETWGDRSLPERSPRSNSSEQTNNLDIEGEVQMRQFLSKESLDDIYRRPIDKRKKEDKQDRSLTDVNKQYKEEQVINLQRRSLETEPYKTQQWDDDVKVRAQQKTDIKLEDKTPRNIEKKTKAEAPRRTEKKQKPTRLEPMVTGRRQRYEGLSQQHGLTLPNGTRPDQSYPATEKKQKPTRFEPMDTGRRQRYEGLSQQHGLMLPNGTRPDQSYPVTEKKQKPTRLEPMDTGRRQRYKDLSQQHGLTLPNGTRPDQSYPVTEKKQKPTRIEPMVTARRQRYEDLSQQHGLMLPNGTRPDQSYPVTKKKRMPPSKQSKKKGQRKRKEPEPFDLEDLGSELLDIMDFGDSDEDTEEDVVEEPQLPKQQEEITVTDEEVRDEEYHKDDLVKSSKISESGVEEDENETEIEAIDDDYRKIDDEISVSLSDQWYEEEGKEVEREANDAGDKEIYNENWGLETCNNKEDSGIQEYKEDLPVISNYKQQLETNEVSEEEVHPDEGMTGLKEAHKMTVEKEELPEELKTTVKEEVVDEDSEEDISETQYGMQPNNEEDDDDEIEESDEEDDDHEIDEESNEEDDDEIDEEDISHDSNGDYDEEDEEEN